MSDREGFLKRRDQLLMQDERIAELEALIQKHNGKCDFMCNPDVCGWHLMRCPNCPKQWKIETAKGE